MLINQERLRSHSFAFRQIDLINKKIKRAFISMYSKIDYSTHEIRMGFNNVPYCVFK